jgi:hypothetical protein
MDLLVARGQIKPEDRDGILASLKQREETMSTGIGFGIAIPHCSSDRLDKVVAAFGRSSTGIEFDALDNAPVKFVVLFIVPKKPVSDTSPHARFHRKILERSQRARSARQRHFRRRDYVNLPRPGPGDGVTEPDGRDMLPHVLDAVRTGRASKRVSPRKSVSPA